MLGAITSEEVVSFLDEIAETCSPETLTVVVLDNAGFHKSKLMQNRRPAWEEQGLFLRFLSPYCPQPHRALVEAPQSLLAAQALLRVHGRLGEGGGHGVEAAGSAGAAVMSSLGLEVLRGLYAVGKDPMRPSL
jgi:hypothetical protein